jgi:DNA transposition AAA+ family ATPase
MTTDTINGHSTTVLTEAPRVPLDKTPSLRVKEFNHVIKSSLEALMKRENLTTTRVAKELGYSIATLSKYLSGKPDGDVTKLESMIEDYVETWGKRRDARATLFPTAVSNEVANALDTIQETNDIGLITGEAGYGKSCGCQLYVAMNPRATLVTMMRCLRNNPRGIIRALRDAGGSRYSHGQTQLDYILEKFTGTNRLIIIDNAHLLSKSGLGFVFDFHDETGSPVALVGNPEILARIRQNDQQFSRIGVHWQVSLPDGDVEIPTKRIIQQYFPDAVEPLYKLANQVVKNQGHLRALKKQLLLTQKMRKGNDNLSPATAFRAAHEMLVRNYILKD